MAVRYDDLPPLQQEWFDDLWANLLTGSDYWVDEYEWDTYREGVLKVDGVKIVPTEEARAAAGLEKFYILSRDALISELQGGLGAYLRDHQRPFFRKFGEAMANLDFARMDYDADIADVIVQKMIFGRIIFS